MSTSSHYAKDVRTTAYQLDSAAAIFAIAVGMASLVAAYGLRHAGFFVWAPVAAIGLASAWLVHARSSVLAASARLYANREDRTDAWGRPTARESSGGSHGQEQ